MPRRATASDAEGTADTTFTINQGPELTRLELLHGSLLDRRLRLEQCAPIRPLLDVVIDGTQIEKLDALGLISKRFVPALAPILKRALEDKDAAVRVRPECEFRWPSGSACPAVDRDSRRSTALTTAPRAP